MIYSRWVIRRTTLLSIGLSLFLGGLIVAKLSLGTVWLLTIVIGILVFTKLLSNKKRILVSLLLCMAFILGLLRGNIYVEKLDQVTNLYGEQVTLTAVANEDAVYSERKQLIFSANDVKLFSPEKQSLIGNIEIEGFGASMVYKGDTVEVTGKLFPKRGENLAKVGFTNITVISRGTSWIDTVRRNFAAGVQNTLPEPLASLGMGLLIGQRSTLSPKLEEQLVAVGLIHIVAVSGYNLTVITRFSQAALQRRSRYQALIGSGALIVIFLLLTGYSPSIVRAAIVSSIGLIAWYYGRNIRPVLLLLLAAVISAGINPLYLWRSISWYLSFTAFYGVLVLAPLIQKRFLKPKQSQKLLPQVLTETLAAQICTLPIILLFFGRLSVISIAANLLVVPLIPFAMLATLIAGIYGMFGPVLFGGVLVLPARFLLEYIVSVTNVLSGLPFTLVSIQINVVQTVIIYAVLLLVTVLLYKRTKNLTPKTNNHMVKA